MANAFVVLGLLPAARAAEILSAAQPVLEAAGFRVGREIGELSVLPGAGGLAEARAAARGQLRQLPLAVGAGPVRCRLRRYELAITGATVTPEGIRLRYLGDARVGDREVGGVLAREIAEDIAELSVTDDAGGLYRVPAPHRPGGISGYCTAPGETRWIPEGEFLVEAVRGGGSAVRWLELSAGAGTPPVRFEISSPAVVPTGIARPPWPTPAECFLDQLAPPAREWSIGSFETGTVELDTAAIVAAVADALVAVGAMPADSAVLTDRVRPDWRLAPGDQHLARTQPWASPGQDAGLAVRLPLGSATAVLERLTAREDMVSVQLYGYPWVLDDHWPLIVPCFRVTAVDDTGGEHEGGRDNWTGSSAYEGSGTFWFWPPVGPQAKQLRVTVSTLWEAAWALVDIPGR